MTTQEDGELIARLRNLSATLVRNDDAAITWAAANRLEALSTSPIAEQTELDETPTGALGLPRWQFLLRADAAALATTDKPLTPEYRRSLAKRLGELQKAITALAATTIARPTEAMIQAGTDELARWTGKNPADIDDCVAASVYHVMHSVAPEGLEL